MACTLFYNRYVFSTATCIGPIHSWLTTVMSKRHMRVVMEVTVDCGVPQGTVLGPLRFLYHINDLPDCVSSQVRLIADDCLLYRTIKNHQDHIKLQEGLTYLESWASTWGCVLMPRSVTSFSVKSSSSFLYSLNGHILQQVQSNPYLRLTFSDDLKWNIHITSRRKSHTLLASCVAI
jgi:hypothetical protein